MESLTKTQLELPGPTAWLPGGDLDRQAAEEATKKALDSLLAHGLVEDMKRKVAKGFKDIDKRDGTNAGG